MIDTKSFTSISSNIHFAIKQNVGETSSLNFLFVVDNRWQVVYKNPRCLSFEMLRSISDLNMSFQIKKMQDRVQKTKDEVQKCREKYEQSLQEINKYNPVYMEDMTSVFIKCQEMEETRLRFFKDVLFKIHKSLNVSKDPRYRFCYRERERERVWEIGSNRRLFCYFSLPQIYEELYHTINNSDHQKDLKWWSNNHGVNMAMNWPSFVVSVQ